MKEIKNFLLIFSIAGSVFFTSCKKETSCEGCNENNKPPITIAGPDQVITLPTDSILLDGSASNDPDGTISVWLWKKISGPASFNIRNSSASITTVKNLTKGFYQFELKVTDNSGFSAKDTLQVIVNDLSQPNRPPVANAGADQTIMFPANTVNVNGSGSTDPDNNITNYEWTKISGPSAFSITNADAVQTQITNLIEGTYQFELKVTDAGGLFSKDTVQIKLNAQIQSAMYCGASLRRQINALLIPVGTLSQARFGTSIAAAGNKILFAGGLEANGNPTPRVDIYDINAGTWSVAELCIGRYMIPAVAAGNKIFFGGGEYGDGTWPVDSVDIYDVSTNTWTVSHLSCAGNGIAAGTVGSKVFFAGGDPGVTGKPGFNRSKQVDIYDLTTGNWSTSLLSESKYGISAVTLNNRIFFSGGFTFSGSSKRIEIYDNSTGLWSIDTMYEGKSFHGGIAAGGKIIWAGGAGKTPDPYTCLVEIKNTTTGTSSIEYLSKPAGWSSFDGQHLVLKNNKIIFLRVWGSERNKFDIYDLITNTWSIGILPQPIPQGSSFISVNNVIYVSSGALSGSMGSQVWKLDF
jgi:hypothetical protein